MENTAKRIQWVDVIKFICIMWVMLCHLEANTEVLRAFYLPFFLNGFYFASGYVYSHRSEFGPFLEKKIRGLFVPWLFFSVFNIIMSQIFTFNNHLSLLEELKWNFLQIRSNGDGMWFVAALFVAYIPFFFFVDKYENSEKGKIDRLKLIGKAILFLMLTYIYNSLMDPNLLPWKSSALPWHIEYMFIVVFWMVLGYLYRNEYETLIDSKVNLILLIFLGAIYLVLCFAPIITGEHTENIIISTIYSYSCSLIGIFVLIYFSKIIVIPNKYFLYIGQNTLICFAFHGKIYSLIQSVIKMVAGTLYASILKNELLSSLLAVFLTIVISLCLMVPIYIINRWFPFLVGRKKVIDKKINETSEYYRRNDEYVKQ